jgi:hypothetical protein
VIYIAVVISFFMGMYLGHQMGMAGVEIEKEAVRMEYEIDKGISVKR